jgi:hypothetical protein
MSSTEVSAASSTAAIWHSQPLGAQPHLRHRFLAGNIDDAPAASASAAQAWISSVDLPMPGSPPISITDRAAARSPPPTLRAEHAVEVRRSPASHLPCQRCETARNSGL